MPLGPHARPTRSRSFIADALAVGGATGLGQLLLLASAPLLSRLYSPEEVGRYGLFLTVLMLATTAANLKFEFAIPSVRSDREALSIGLAALVLPFPVALIAGGACAVVWASGVPGFAADDAWVRMLIVPALIINGMFTALRYWHVRRGAFSLIGRAMIAQSAGRARGARRCRIGRPRLGRARDWRTRRSRHGCRQHIAACAFRCARTGWRARRH